MLFFQEAWRNINHIVHFHITIYICKDILVIYYVIVHNCKLIPVFEVKVYFWKGQSEIIFSFGSYSTIEILVAHVLDHLKVYLSIGLNKLLVGKQEPFLIICVFLCGEFNTLIHLLDNIVICKWSHCYKVFVFVFLFVDELPMPFYNRNLLLW